MRPLRQRLPHRRLVPTLVVAVLAVLAGPAYASAAVLEAGATFPDSVAVGDTEIPASVQFTYTGAGKFLPSAIKLTPSCASQALPCSPSDAGVFTTNGTGVGGGVCAGRTFSVSAPAADGTITLTAIPGDSHNPTVDPLEVASGGTCVVSLSLNVVKLPTVDTSAAPGLQTIQQAQVLGMSSPDGLPQSASGSDQSTVRKRTPTLSSTAFGDERVGGQLSDTATLASAFSPGGTVTFTLFGPDDLMCAGPPAFATTIPVVSPRTTSSPFSTTAAGTYRWTASYSGDVNNDPAAAGCNTPGSTLVVSKAAPTLQFPTASPPAGAGPLTLGVPRLSPSAFRAANSGPSTAARVGTVVTYSLSHSARVTFRIERAGAGRRAEGRCVKQRRSGPRGKRCTRYMLVSGSFTHAGSAGSNKFKFRGRMHGRKLRPGRYRLRALARDAAGRQSQVRRRAFRVLR